MRTRAAENAATNAPSTRRVRPRRWMIACFALAALAAGSLAHAQRLDLSAGRPPGPNEALAALSLATSLSTDAGSLSSQASRAGGPGSAPRESLRFRAEMRRLAAEFIRAGESLGDDGAPLLLHGRTLAAAIPEIDALAERLRAEAEADAEFLRAVSRFNAARSEGSRVPADLFAADTHLRDLLGEIVERRWPGTPSPPVWRSLPTPPPLGPDIDRWVASGALAPDSGQRLAAFDADLTAAAAWWCFRADAADVRILVRGAARAAADLPQWAAGAPAEALSRRFSLACDAVMDKATRRAGMEELRRLGAAGALLRDLDAADLPAQTLAPARRDVARALVGGVGGEGAGAGHGIANEAALAALTRAVSLLTERAALGDEAQIERDLIPAWRALQLESRRAETDLAASLGRIAAAPGSLTDPGTVALIAHHRRCMENLRAVRTISEALGPRARGEGRSQAQRRLAGERVSRLGRQLGAETHPDIRDAALGVLRDFARDLRLFSPMPGEGEAGADAILGDSAVAVWTAVEAARGEWLSAWAGIGQSRVERREATDASIQERRFAARLGAFRGLLGAVRDAAALANLADASGWPQWQLSEPVAARISREAREGLSELAASLLAEPDSSDVHRRIDGRARAGRSRAVAARLVRSTPPDVAATPPLAQVCAGGAGWVIPEESPWPRRQRARLASLARVLEEWSAVSQPAERDRLWIAAERIANEILDVLGPEAPPP